MSVARNGRGADHHAALVQHFATTVSHPLRDAAADEVHRLTERMGGRARMRTVVILACILGLSTADLGAVAAVAVQLEQGLRVGNADIGLMVTVSSLIGATFTVPVGALTDRFRRVTLLWLSIALWTVAEAGSALAPTFGVLLATRVALGAVTATAGPTVASLVGDLFAPRERGRMWGFILTGELLGAGAGVLIAGLTTSLFGWRAALMVLAVPAGVLSLVVRRYLPEPERGGQSWLPQGSDQPAVHDEIGAKADRPGDDSPEERSDGLVHQVEDRGIRPEPSIVVHGDASRMTLWEAVRYVLRVRTNLVLIVASSLGYFFFTGLETFAIVFLKGQYGVNAGMATLVLLAVGAGAVAGVLVAGHMGDALICRGHLDARLLIGAVGFIGSAVVLAPAILSNVLALSVPLFVVAGFAVATPNPSLDAARLDVVPGHLWGRAEGVRTLLRQSLQALAPLLFGLVSASLGGSHAGFASGVNAGHAAVSPAGTSGLQYTFLIMLVPVVAGGLLLFAGRRSYPVDVVSAAESDRGSVSGSGSPSMPSQPPRREASLKGPREA